MNVALFVAIYKFSPTSNLFKYFRERYDQPLIQVLNRILSLRGKRARTKEGIIFLQNCLNHRVTPSHIKDRVRKAKPKDPYGIERVFIRDEIEKKRDFLQVVVEECNLKFPAACKQLSFLDKIRFCKLLIITQERLITKTKEKYASTLQYLLESQHGVGVLRHSTIVNLTGFELSDMQKDVLCRGLNYGIPPRISKEEIEAEFELCWQQLEELPAYGIEERKECQAAMAHLAQRYGNERIDMTGFPLSKEELKTIKELRQNPDIVITRPDKGNGVVLLKTEDYLEKMGAILSDETKFVKLGDVDTNDHTLQHERALQAYLLRAMKANKISADVYHRIRPVGATRPRMYGIPKIHKQGTPLRPILSMVNAPQQEMAKWLAEQLAPVVNKFSTHTIKDTFQFVENLKAFEESNTVNDIVLCSFDIVSLFTNVPLNRTVEICLDTLYRDDKVPKPPVPEDLLHKLLIKATTDVEFSFNGTMYKQLDGVAMGSPLGPVLANIFVGYCESLIDCQNWPLFYNRFVDDTFSIFSSEQQIALFFTKLNELDPSLQFTMEKEHDSSLPFMDVNIKKEKGNLVRSIYRKPTFTGIYTRWDSFAASGQKIGLMRALTSRAIKICSSSTLPDELKKLRSIFVDNGYPSELVGRIIKMPGVPVPQEDGKRKQMQEDSKRQEQQQQGEQQQQQQQQQQ